MNRIPLKVWNRIEMLQQPIAARAAAASDNLLRWVEMYYNINRNSVVAYPAHRYCIIDTEFDRVLLEEYQLYGDEDWAIVTQASYAVGMTSLCVWAGFGPGAFSDGKAATGQVLLATGKH